MKKKILLGILILIILLIPLVWYLFAVKFDNTNDVKANFKVEALAMINEFNNNSSAANAKYVEKVVEVTGSVGSIEKVDSTANIKMIDEESGSYLIFAFQSDQNNTIKQIKPHQKLIIRGSCSGGMFSEIMESNVISFKRCIIVNQ
jgi:hypothetical protein